MRSGEEIRGTFGRVERLTVVREVSRPPEGGAIGPTAFLAHAFAPEGAELVVVERYRNLSPASRDILLADAKRASGLRFPNLGQVEDVGKVGPDVFIATRFVEGELLGALREAADRTGRPLPIDAGVRVVVDVLAALSALHTDKPASAPKGVPPVPLVHGSVAPHTVAVGFDGVTRLVRPYVGRLVQLGLDAAAVPYAAPEQLRTGKGSPRADIYSVGVILWELLAQKRLFEKATKEARLGGASGPPPVPKLVLEGEQAWAAPLAPIVEKALSTDPLSRYGTAAEMAAAVRLAVRAKLAMPVRVAEIVDRYAGERILARRGELALAVPSSGDRRSVRPSVPDEAARALKNLRPSSRPPTPTPAAVAPIAVPKAPPLPSPSPDKPRAPNPGPRPVMSEIELTPPPSSEIELIEDVESVRPPVAAPPVPAPAPAAAPPPPVVAKPPERAPIAAPAPREAPSGPALMTPDPIAVPADDAPAGVPSSNRKWLPALLLLLPILGLILFFALRKPETTGETGAPSGTKLVPPPTDTTTVGAPTASTAPTATTTVVPSATTTGAPPTSASASSADAATNAVPTTTSTYATPRPSNSTARPKPTYDPEGI